MSDARRTDGLSLSPTDLDRDYLFASLARVEEAVRAVAARQALTQRPEPPAPVGRPPALEALCQAFDLGRFERDVLLLGVAGELLRGFPAACAAAQGDPRASYPTFALALAALPGGSWEALLPDRPLRRWSLVELDTGPLAHARLRVDESVCQALLGLRACPPRLAAYLRPLPPPTSIAPSHATLADRVARSFGKGGGRLAQLVGRSFADQVAVARRVAQQVGVGLEWLPGEALPLEASEARQLAQLWARDQRLAPRVLLIDWHEVETNDVGRAAALGRLLAGDEGLVLLATPDRRVVRERTCATFDVAPASAIEQVGLWEAALGALGEASPTVARRLAGQFDLDAAMIEAAARQGLARGLDDFPATDHALEERLWATCSAQVNHGLEALASRVSTQAEWPDLVVGPETLEVLHEIVAQVQHRTLVLDEWGFAGPSRDVVGTTVLFAGPSGTGKTLAAQVLARALRLDLYRIDLSQVVSKYVGDTEKNLRQVFDAADRGGAVLLFDEADAVFGKRSGEVRDSHDRHANLQVGYLLQRLERFRGLGILTTNQRDALDVAFLRRLHHVIDFPFPDAAQRQQIWGRAMPAAAPRDSVDPGVLARLDVAGGSIRLISLNAAYLAAADPTGKLAMRHLIRAARRECAKLGRSTVVGELEGWNG